ncbi:hypothetical protein ACHQM5_023712 [Ranunculus cassubicifolius]
MDISPKLLTISEIIHKSTPLSGTISLNPSPNPIPQENKSLNPNLSINFVQNPNPKILPFLNYPTMIIGTVNLPVYSNSSSTKNSVSCNCLSFSDDTGKVCCDVLEFDVKIIGKEIHVVSWNFVPLKCGGSSSGLLEIIRWKLPDSSISVLNRCSNIDTFPLDCSSSLLKSCKDEVFEARSGVFGRVESISPVLVVPCAIQNRDSESSSGNMSAGSRNVRGFLAELMVCKCKLCRSKSSVMTLFNCVQGENNHQFDIPAMIYFFESTASWHPVLLKLLGNVICITGLKKKLIFVGKDNSSLMYITTEKAALRMPLFPRMHLSIQKDEIKGMGESGAYTGSVTGIYMQGMVVELDNKVWLVITDQILAPPHPIRVGALISVRNVHFVCPKFSWTKTLLLGACFKTNIKVKSFSPLESQCHIRLQTQSMLSKFIESLVFSARFWLLLIVSSFKRIFAGILSEKEILGSKHTEGLAQMYAKLYLPSSVFRPRVVTISVFISHCEGMWLNVILQLGKDSQGSKKNFFWCEGKSYQRLIRKIISSEDFGVVLMGTLQISPSSGHLQLVDASGSIDVVIPDFPSNYDANNLYEVMDYSVVIEGLPEEDDTLVKYENETFSCRNILHRVPSTRGRKPTSVYAHFYLRNTNCLNACLRVPRMDWNDNIIDIKGGLFHLLLVTHNFPTTEKFHMDPMNKQNSFVEAIIFPWNLFVHGEDNSKCLTRISKKNLKEHLEFTSERNTSEYNCQKRAKLVNGSTRTVNSALKDDLEKSDFGLYSCSNNCNNHNSGAHTGLKSTDIDSFDELPCSVLMRSFSSQRPARPGLLRRADHNTANGKFGKLKGRKTTLEIKSTCFRNNQWLQVGGYYIMTCRNQVHVQNATHCCYVTGGNIVVTSQTPLWSVSFSCDEVLSPSEPVQKRTSPTASLKGDVVPCESSSISELFFLRSHSHNPDSCSVDIIICLSVAARNLLNLDMEAVYGGLVEPIVVSRESDKNFMFTMGVSMHSSETSDPDCRLPQGNLISLTGNVVDVHSFDCRYLDFKTHLNATCASDQHKGLFQGLSRNICVHISKHEHYVKLRGTLNKHAYPSGMGSGVTATFHRVLVVGQNELMLTPVSFIEIISVRNVSGEQSDNFDSHFGSAILKAKPLYAVSSSFFSEPIQHVEIDAMRFRCRVVAMHVLVLENQNSKLGNSRARELPEAPCISIPCASFVLDDGSLPCCLWATAKIAAELLRLNDEIIIKDISSNNSQKRLNQTNTKTTSMTGYYHLQKILKHHHRITIKNYGSTFDSSHQDLTFSVSSNNNVLSSSDETLLKLVIFNACCGPVFNIAGSAMDSNAIRRLEDLSGMDMTMNTMQNIVAREVQYVDPRTEATNLIQELMEQVSH